MPTKQNPYLLIICYILLVACNGVGDSKKKSTRKDSIVSIPLAVNQQNIPAYVNDPLDNFLNKISLAGNVKKIPLNLVRVEGNKFSGKVMYGGKSLDVVLFEQTLEQSNLHEEFCALKHFYINGAEIKNFIRTDSEWNADAYRSVMLNRDDDDTLSSSLIITPQGDFLQFEGYNETALSHNFRSLTMENLVPINNTPNFCFLFSSIMYIPKGLYVGYNQGNKELIYLNFEFQFPRDTGEYIFDVYANRIKIENKSVVQLKDDNGTPYHIQLAIPNCYNNSRYRIIDSNWW